MAKQVIEPAERRAIQVARSADSGKNESRSENVLIIGATSSLARAFASILAKRNTRFFLAARNGEEAQRVGKDLTVRYGCQTWSGVFVADDYASHEALFEQARKSLGTIDGVFVAVGELGNQRECQSDFTKAKSVIDASYTGVASLLTYAGDYFEKRKSGYIIAVGSVAGDRGRQANYVYGSAKAAMAAYLQGLRHRLSGAGILVMTVKPGFLDTKMTFGLLKGPLIADVHSAAEAIVTALDRKEMIVYVPWFWRYIMLIIHLIPERLFVRTKI